MTDSSYSTATLSVVSLSLISILLIAGSTIGFSLSERKSLAKLETQRKIDRYILSQALNSMEGVEFSSAEEVDQLTQIDSICDQNLAGSDDQDDLETQATIITRAFHCTARSQVKPGWNILYVTSLAGYSGEISMVVGLEGSSTLGYLKVLSHRETAGFGTRLLKPASKWLSDMIGRPASFFQSTPLVRTAAPVDISAVPEEIDAVSGATITAQAVIHAIDQSFNAEVIRTMPSEQ